jgi:hypothetical protein
MVSGVRRRRSPTLLCWKGQEGLLLQPLFLMDAGLALKLFSSAALMEEDR